MSITVEMYIYVRWLTLPVSISDEQRKIYLIFIFEFLCGASNGFMKKACVKPSKAPQRSVKIII